MSESKIYKGLYRPDFERDNCGFGLIAHMDGASSHWLVSTAIEALGRMTHRGAIAADGKTGDGCGLLMKKPDSFLRAVAAEAGLALADDYAVGVVFLSRDEATAAAARECLAGEVQAEGLEPAGWRPVPTDPSVLGDEATRGLPRIEHLFVNPAQGMDGAEFERHLFIARRRTEKRIEPADETFYVSSLSARVVSYKGLMMPDILADFYPDLKEPDLE
ncbi:MAG TPA: glutamate synthase large subunit, partial [Gammaproteobacteria bacterium]